MKPLRSTLFFLAVMALLLGLSLVMPEEGIEVNGRWNLHFATVEDLLHRDTLDRRAHLEGLLSRSTVTEDPEFKPNTELVAPAGPEWKSASSGSSASSYIAALPTKPSGPSPSGQGNTDRINAGVAGESTEPPAKSTKPPSESTEPPAKSTEPPAKSTEPPGEVLPVSTSSRDIPASRVAPANRDSLLRAVHPITFAENNREILHSFFHKLAGLREGAVDRTRILHFGDSQIENDRMTALIRFRLQMHFGGAGTGLVPAVPIYSGHLAYEKEEHGNWLRYTFFGKRDTSIRHRYYGVMSAFASVPGSRYGEWPMLHYRFNTSRQTGRFDRIRIFMHSFTDEAKVAFTVNDTISDTLVNIIDGFSVAENIPGVLVKDLKISMGLPEGGRIYGLSFDSDRGVQVDNIAMRGSSGLTFSKMDRYLLEDMIGELSPGLILLQFGGNVVPYMKADYYRGAIRRELAFFREICPDVPIILIGPADMSTKERGMLVSYPSLEAIRNALRDAALESGCGFWDLYQAMGGRNSMPGFVEADPPLARTDYIHFTSLGANLVAEMFYNSLMAEYNQYLNTLGRPRPGPAESPITIPGQ